MHIELDEHAFITAEVEETDESFSHEHGIEKRTDYEIKSWSLMVYIDSMDYDLTKGLNDKERDYFEQKIYAKAMEE